MRVFLDANVLFSASNPGTNIARLIHLLLRGSGAVTSDLAAEEARRNILFKRPAWSDEFDRLIARVQIVPSVVFALPVTVADKDVSILCAAIRAKCDYFVTGDKRDFGYLFDRRVGGVTIISPLGLAKLLAGSQGGW